MKFPKQLYLLDSGFSTTSRKKRNYFLELANLFINSSIFISLYTLLLGLEGCFFTSKNPFFFKLCIVLLDIENDSLSIFSASENSNHRSFFLLYSLQYLLNHSGTRISTFGIYFPIIGKFIYFIVSHIRKVLIGGDRSEAMKEIIFDIETTTLEPFEDYARVIAIGVKCGNIKRVITGLSEESLLRKFWDLSFFEGYFKLIGFNCFSFDLPYLLARSLKYKIKIPQLRGNVIDIRLILSFGNKYKKGKLTDYAKLILGKKGEKLDGINGSFILELWKKKDIETIEKYCMKDVSLTYEVYFALKEMGVLN